MMMFDKMCMKMMVFKRAQDWDSDNDGSRTVSGSEFRKVGPEAAKRLCLYLIVLERGTLLQGHHALRSIYRCGHEQRYVAYDSLTYNTASATLTTESKLIE